MTPAPLSVGATVGDVYVGVVLGMGVLAFVVASGAAGLYRAVMAERSPMHLPLVLSVGAVGLWMNTAATIVEYVERTVAAEPVLLQQMATNSAAVAGAFGAGLLGARFGDRAARRFGGSAARPSRPSRLDALVQTVGRFIEVTLPPEADVTDVEGFEPVPEAVREALGATTFRFPRGLTVSELHERVTDRIRDDYQVGHVDLELDGRGRVTHLGVGSRAGGLGPTLQPRKVAVGIETTPAPGASPGDRVRIWQRADGGAERVGPAELRSAGDRAATVVMDERHLDRLDLGADVRLVTLRSTGRTSLEFASLLRAANETLRPVQITEGSALVGVPVGAVRQPILGVVPPEGTMVPLPPAESLLEPGATVYVVGRHDELRRFERAAGGAGD